MLYIIVPCHNRLQSTIQFFESLKKQKFKNYKVILIDDGSVDNTAAYIATHYSNVVVLKGDGTLYWGGAINLGIQYIRDFVNFDVDMVAFANNDVEFHEDTIEILVAACQKQDIGVFHALVMNRFGMCMSSGAIILSWAIFFTRHPFRGKGAQDLVDLSPLYRIDLATARLLLFKSKVLKIVDGIDTRRFRHYAGDNDFSLTLKENNVFTYIVPASRCVVDVSTTGDNPGIIKGFGAFFKSLFSMKSTNNLKVRWLIGIKHCSYYLLPFYMMAVLFQVVLLNIRSILNLAIAQKWMLILFFYK